MAERPLSPHLTIWKWGPHMLVSILHRATGGYDGHDRLLHRTTIAAWDG